MIKKIRSKLSKFKTKRGTGFPGDGKQQLRTKQIEIMRGLTKNEAFISHFPELLTCNESWTTVADKIDVGEWIKDFFAHTKSWMNYADQIQSLEAWVDSKGHVWPNLHPAHQHVVDACKELRPASVLEVGAGAGVVAKYVYAAMNGEVKLSCLEGSDAHIAEMKENFNKSKIIPPDIEVKADVVKGVVQAAPFADNSFELVYTCTVMMHNSYIAAVLAAAEIARISSKYVLHVEGNHTDGIFKLYKSKHDLLLIDYERLYEKLGYKTIKKMYYQDPYSTDYDYVVYLAEKI
jgi:SAM-dependent methyltransferase